MTYCVTKATPLHFINRKCHIKQLKSGKSKNLCNQSHMVYINHIRLLVINGLGDRHTDICRHRHTHKGTQTHRHIHIYHHVNQSNFKKSGIHLVKKCWKLMYIASKLSTKFITSFNTSCLYIQISIIIDFDVLKATCGCYTYHDALV